MTYLKTLNLTEIATQADDEGLTAAARRKSLLDKQDPTVNAEWFKYSRDTEGLGNKGICNVNVGI